MSIKFDEKNHPFVDLGDSFSITLNRAAYEEDKRRRLHDNDVVEADDETTKALKELRHIAETKSNLNLVADRSNWTVMLYLQMYDNDAKKAFDLIDFGYRLLHKEPEYKLYYTEVRHVFEEGFIRFLPEPDDDGSLIFVVEMSRRWNPSKIPLYQFIAAMRIGGLAMMLNPEAQRNGCKVLFDVDGISMSHISHFSPRSSNFLFDLIEKCTPIETKGMHTVNNGMMYNVLFAILKPFMSKQLRERTYMHGKSWSSLTKHISPRCLPPKYGGTLEAPECDGKVFAEYLQHYEGYFSEYNSYGYTGNPDAK